MIASPQATRFDREAMRLLVASWTERLPIDNMASGDADAVCCLSAAVNAFVDPRDLKDMRPQAFLGDAILLGVDISLAILSDPVGDPRESIMSALEQFREELVSEAKMARRDQKIDAWNAARHEAESRTRSREPQ